MIGTVCFIADLDTENFLSELKVEASECFHVGVTGGNIPRHISLGMPYHIIDWNSYVSYVEEFASSLHPVEAEITEMGTTCFPTAAEGAFYVHFKENFGLDEIRDRLKAGLKESLGIEVADNLKGKRITLLGCKTAPVENYKEFVSSLDPSRYAGRKMRFDKLGIFYYPSENWDPSTYTCYRRIRLV